MVIPNHLIMLFSLKLSIIFAPTSAWMHVGRAMQEQLPRADAPTSSLSTHKLNSHPENAVIHCSSLINEAFS